MKLTFLFFFICCLHVAAIGISQTVSFSGKDVSLQEVFAEVKKQTGFVFFFDADLLKDARSVTIAAENRPLGSFLSELLEGRPLKFSIHERAVVISRKLISDAIPDSRKSDDFLPPVPIKIIITDAEGSPLSGASVLNKKTNKSGVTDAEGVLHLIVSPGDLLRVSYVNFVVRDFVVSSVSSPISISLTRSEDKLDESIVTAYGTSTQKSFTGAVTVIKGEDVQNLPNMSVDKSLQGLVPGLLVTSGSGQPGGGPSNFVLRGIATGGSDNIIDGLSSIRNPLIVVDGIPVSQDPLQLKTTSITAIPTNNPMSQINPSDIEAISVLKDAVAIALYGSKASNGVILITTKKGKSGKAKLNFRSQTDITNRIKTNVELLTQNEYLSLLYETYKNSNVNNWTDEKILADLKSRFPTRTDGSFYPFTNLTPLLYRDNATTYTNNLSVSGGGDRSTFYLNLEWTKQNGIYRKTGYDRKSLRFNFDNKIANWLKIGLNTGLSYNIQDYNSIGSPQYGAIFYASPLNPIYLENGDYYLNYNSPTNAINPVAALEYNSSKNTNYRALTKFFAEVALVKGVKLTTNLGIDYMYTEAKEKRDPRLRDPENVTASIGTGRITVGNFRNANIINTNILSFEKSISNKNNVSLLIGHEAQLLTQANTVATGTSLRYYSSEQIDQAATTTSLGSQSKQTLLSYFTQLNYDLNKKYFFSASARTDGSSRFGDKKKFNTYWSTGLGWIASSETFIKKAASWVDYFKIRGSLGVAGNSGAIDQYLKYDQLAAVSYLSPSSTALIPYATVPANSAIKPEQTLTMDAGIEMKLWKQRISISADFYNRKTYDLIYQYDNSLISGYASVKDNIGDMINRGVELSLSMDIIKTKKIRWNLNTNWSTNKNKLIKANQPLVVVYGSQLANAEGQNFNSFYLKVWAGVNPATGQSQFLDSSGKPTTNESQALLQFVGKPQPDGFGAVTNSISYSDLTLSFQFYYQYGFEVYNNNVLLNDGSSPYDNQSRDALNRWQKTGDAMSLNPQRLLNNPLKSSTRYLFKGDYIRLQNVCLSFNFPQKLLQAIHLNSLQLYAQAYNIAVWNLQKKAQDIGNVNMQGQLGSNLYPIAKSYSLGLNLNF